MIIERKTISVRDLYENYKDDGDGGVFAYDNNLIVRPPYQREFIYKDAQREAVIDSIVKRYPLSIMYWSKRDDGKFEVLDGQQRTISICQYIHKDYSINHRFWHNLTDDEKNHILDYELDIYVCEGTDSEKLQWFRRINIAGEVLTDQELLNAAYTGPWLTDAKIHFSKRNCVAGQISEGYLKGNPLRQDLLEKVLSWIADRDGMDTGADYMAEHQHDTDANELWTYFQNVINWAKILFPKPQKGITDSQEWGILYNKYKDKTYNSNTLNQELKNLKLDDDVMKNSGIIPYLLSERLISDERHLNIRSFSEKQKMTAYEEQGGICPVCDKHFEIEEMEGDHITPWHEGGKTEQKNLQMLCRTCNRQKSGK